MIGFVLLSLTGKTKAQIGEFNYISPRPGAKYVSPDTTIVFRLDNFENVNDSDFEQNRILIFLLLIHQFFDSEATI